LQSYVAELLPANSSDPNALTMATLQGTSLVQINSSAAVLALAKSAGFKSIKAFMPGLQMFWDDVSQGMAGMLAHPDHSAAIPAVNRGYHTCWPSELVLLLSNADDWCPCQLLHVSAQLPAYSLSTLPTASQA
jgi:hypothetical protein